MACGISLIHEVHLVLIDPRLIFLLHRYAGHALLRVRSLGAVQLTSMMREGSISGKLGFAAM